MMIGFDSVFIKIILNILYHLILLIISQFSTILNITYEKLLKFHLRTKIVGP